MTEKDVKNAISEIEVPNTLKGDVLDAVAAAKKPKLTYAKKRMLFTALILVVCLSVTFVTIPILSSKNYSVAALATAKDIEELSYFEYSQNLYDNGLSVDSDVTNDALLAMSSKVLSDTSGNAVFSPMAVYMSLGMLQEMADGNTKKQILDFIGMDDASVRETYKMFYEVLCMNTEDAHLFMSNSAWFNEVRDYNEQTVSNMAEYYYADIFNADFDKSATKRQMQQWLKDNSDDTFGSPEDVGPMDCIIKLFSVLDFLSKWQTEPGQIEMDFTPDGGNKHTVDGLNFLSGTGNKLDGMSVGRIPFKNGYTFTAILPEGGNTVSDILSDASLLGSAFGDMSDKTAYRLHCQMPKFSIESDFNLIPPLSELGMSDMFNSSADFSRITDRGQKDLYVSAMISKVNIEVDEHGCKAKAMVRVDMKETAADGPSQEILKLTLDRPFIYAVCYDNVPLFIGTVANP